MTSGSSKDAQPGYAAPQRLSRAPARALLSTGLGALVASWARVRGRRLPGQVSIGTKLTVRYTATVSVTLTAAAVFVYLQVVQRINREARLLLEIQSLELVEQLNEHRQLPLAERLTAIEPFMDRFVRSTDPELGLTVEVVGADGERLLQAGATRTRLPPFSRVVLDGRYPKLLRAMNTGDEHALLALEMRIADGALRVIVDGARYANNVRHIRDVFLWSGPLVLALTALIGWLLARSSLRPISEILAAARRVSATDLDQRVPESGSGDELDQLAQTLNQMLRHIRRSMVQMRRFNANAAHQLRTPLTVISSQLELTLTREAPPEEYRHAIGEILARVREISEGVAAMLHLSQIEAGLPQEQRSIVDIRSVAETVVEYFSPVAEEKGIDLRSEGLPAARVAGQAQWLHELFSNLVANSLAHTPRGGKIHITGFEKSPNVVIEVTDTGTGIPAEKRRLVFERFERAALSSPGFGLGLPIAQEIAQAHGGEIQLVASEGPGTRMSVVLPCSRLPGDSFYLFSTARIRGEENPPKRAEENPPLLIAL